MQFQNIYSLLEATAAKNPTNGMRFYQPGKVDAKPVHFKYTDLVQRSLEKAKLVQQLASGRGGTILIHFDNHLDNLEWFWAVVCAGYVPAFSTPFVNNPEQRLRHILHLHSILEDPICLTTQELFPQFEGQAVLRIQTIESLRQRQPDLANGSSNGYIDHVPGNTKSYDDVAVLMLTSGSTGNAKAVALTHKQILTSIAGKAHINKTHADGPFLNWIGLDHVAGLTEMHLHAVWVGAEQVYVQATDLVPSPLLFLEIINQQRVSHSFATNSFLHSLRVALNSPASAALKSQLDLSCLKTIVTGGEANVVETCVALSQTLQDHGSGPNVLTPAFGMTETSGGSVYSKKCPDWDTECNNEFAAVGICIPGAELRIVGNDGVEIKHRLTGNLEMRGAAIFQQYYNNVEATAESFNGECEFPLVLDRF